jgi:hypothetical protein
MLSQTKKASTFIWLTVIASVSGRVLNTANQGLTAHDESGEETTTATGGVCPSDYPKAYDYIYGKGSVCCNGTVLRDPTTDYPYGCTGNAKSCPSVPCTDFKG